MFVTVQERGRQGMKKKIYIAAALCISVLLIIIFICAVRMSEKTEKNTIQNAVPGLVEYRGTEQPEVKRADECEETDEYDAETISLSSTEQKEIRKHVLNTVETCRGIYEAADKGNADNVVLSDSDMKKLADCLAAKGDTVSCGGNIYNMQNEESLDQVLNRAMVGEDAVEEFFHITKSGVFEWRKLEFSKGDMTMTYAGAVWMQKEETLEPHISYLEKVKVYDWKYTNKGWLIIEISKSRNHEMDMHSMFRVLPLPQECREYCSKYIEPVSYMGNNLFLTDWDEENLDKVVFNDVFEFFYKMDTGMNYKKKQYPEGVPKDLYESIITSHFPISATELQQLPGYSEENQTYSWNAMECGTVIPQPQPFPEVVEVTNQEDGSIILTVDAGLLHAGTDHAFTHGVTIKPGSDGKMQYLGNRIIESEENKMPGYMPRMNYQ